MAASPAGLFATSWTVHRVATLYHGKECKTLLDNPAALKLYASRLRDILTGDVLRGVQLSGTGTSAVLDETLSKAGALKSCRWECLPTWRHWNEEQSLLEDPDEEGPVVTPDQASGLIVILEYETIMYKAALLSGPDGYRDVREEGATYLPLLVTRMPNALRQEFISFLSTNFDTRISVLRLPPQFICAALENYMATLNRPARTGQRNADHGFIERIIKETQLTISFSQPISPALRSMDVLLPRESLGAFYSHGTSNSGSESTEAPTTPFLTALSEYFNTHLAMPLDISTFQSPTTTKTQQPSHMRLTKVSCGAFVLGSEGRVKFLSNPGRAILLDEEDDYLEAEDPEDVEEREKRLIWRANEELLRSLVKRAVGREG